MKKLQKIKLDELAGIDLNEKSLCRILGGRAESCRCGCLYADTGGSSSSSNTSANTSGSIIPSYMCDPKQEDCSCEPDPTPLGRPCEPPPIVQDAICGPHGGGLY